MTSAAPHHMVHPGPVADKRIVWASSRLVQVEGQAGKQGQALTDAIAEFAASHGISSGNGMLRDCALKTTRFTTGGPARDGKAANYTWIRELGASTLPAATFTFGVDLEGAPFVHCHAILESDALPHRSAGHLFPPDCILGGTFDIAVSGLPDIVLTQKPDDETLHSMFEPDGSQSHNEDALFVRLRPNIDVIGGIEDACHSAGVTNARILPSVGSVNAPVLAAQDGMETPLASLGMEVQAFEGTVRDGKASVSATLCNEDGAIFSGRLVKGLVPICVTAELVIVRD